ncbi:MAG: glycosyltransferase [Candidatus Pseudobacter hemicellulosilyticus]|uniref:Glycosyltransferase n=1 Tax=Candidatus Pseudobacter hemicellulosilyticus TaxID=3121375 RepID=A0AAJ5WM02_9BACT|nr:MAG: glycosyltransferase [Pseudobacter sp.]
MSNASGRKVSVVLFFCALRTGHFGQKTFVDRVISFFREDPGIDITIIHTDSTASRELTIVKEDGITNLLVPAPENKMHINALQDQFQKKYAHRLLDILFPYVRNLPNVVFWVNSIDYLNVCVAIRERFENVQLLYVHHAWSWKGFINMADQEFARHWKKGNNAISPGAFEMTGYQQKIASLADRIITVTAHASTYFEEVLGIHARKLRLIYNGIDTEREIARDKKALKHKYGIGEQEQLIIFAGRLTKEKGAYCIVDAFNLVAQRHSNSRLLVIGDGEIAKCLSRAASNWSRISFTGEITHEQVQELYSIAAIGVQPSLIEQCSFTALEMALYHLPMLVSNDIGLNEMFRDGIDALMVGVKYDTEGIKYLDPEEIADKLIYLLENPSVAETLGERAYDRVSQKFNIQQMRRGYMDTIETFSNSFEPAGI